LKQITILLTLLVTTHLFADVKKGKAIYAANCAICHTVNGGRAMGPDFNIVSYTRTKE
jgi:mono/diheme cytochrome c family protein